MKGLSKMSLADRRYSGFNKTTSSKGVLAELDTDGAIFTLEDDLTITRTNKGDGNQIELFRISDDMRIDNLNLDAILEGIVTGIQCDRYKFIKFKRICETMIEDKLRVQAVTDLSLEDKYNILLEGVKRYIPSNLLLEYEGTDEEKLIKFLSQKVG